VPTGPLARVGLVAHPDWLEGMPIHSGAVSRISGVAGRSADAAGRSGRPARRHRSAAARRFGPGPSRSMVHPCPVDLERLPGRSGASSAGDCAPDSAAVRAPGPDLRCGRDGCAPRPADRASSGTQVGRDIRRAAPPVRQPGHPRPLPLPGAVPPPHRPTAPGPPPLRPPARFPAVLLRSFPAPEAGPAPFLSTARPRSPRTPPQGAPPHSSPAVREPDPPPAPPSHASPSLSRSAGYAPGCRRGGTTLRV
jgi:hypothetical protein